MSRCRHISFACLVIAFAGANLAAAQESSQSPDAADDIAIRIRQLGDDSFAVRQSASLALNNAGPEAIAPLADAAHSNDPEIRTRALAVLLAMARGRSERHVLAAHRALSALADAESPAVSRRANTALVQLQGEIAQDMERLGGTVRFDSRRRISYVSLNERPAGDEQLTPILLLSQLETLNLSRTQITSRGLLHLGELPRLSTLELRFTAIDNTGLAPLAQIPALLNLNLQGTQIDDGGAERLADLTALKLLSVERTAITDRGLESLCRLAHLETLYLGESEITGEGLSHLACLPRLKYLSLRKLSLADQHIAPLGACTQLESVGLDETPVTSACLVHLQHLPRLRILWLTNSHVDDEGISSLSQMKLLERLHLRGTKLTPAGVERLKRSLPSVEITF